MLVTQVDPRYKLKFISDDVQKRDQFELIYLLSN